MAVTIQIDVERLNDPAVAKALANLVLALGGAATGQQKPAVPAADAPKVEAPKPAAATAPAAAPRAEAPKAAPKAQAPKAEAPKAADDDVAARYREFVANLPPRSKAFLDLVRDRGTLTIDEAMKELGIDVPKAMGGITGSIGRWAPVRGVPVPYKAITVNGERAWEWLGAPDDGAEGSSPKAEAPAGVTSGAATPKGADSAAMQAAREAAIEKVIEGLPERASLFVRTLRQRGMLTMPEVLDKFSLAKARAVSGIVDPVLSAFEAAGVEVPFAATFAPTGDKAWVWSKSGADATPEVEPVEASPEDSGERGVSAAQPGVRVRRRAR